MKIGIDARLYKETGVGRYIRSLIHKLAAIDKKNQYVLFLLSEDYDKIMLPPSGWKKQIANVYWHTLKEQFIMPAILNKENLDLMHFPYFNVPIFYRKKFIVTIHDLTILNFTTGRASTHNPLFYKIKRLGFKMALNHAIYRSEKIITVSESVKKEICNVFKIDPNKISVTYESGELESTQVHEVEDLPKEYILYVGNAHPHKNIETLLLAFKQVKGKFPKLKMLLIGNDNFFYKRLRTIIMNLSLKDDVIIKGPISNDHLTSFYKNALAFIFPSLSEGFGIPGLEAMSLGCPVIASNIPTFREIYGSAAIYFNPKSVDDITQKIENVLQDEVLKQEIIKKGYERAKLFSWQKMAGETLKVYESCLGI